MANTISYLQAWDIAALQFRKDLNPALQETALNMAISKMWAAFDWRGSVVDMIPFWLEAGVQDYGYMTSASTSDFGSIREAYIVMPNGDSPIWSPPLGVVRNLQQTSDVGVPSALCYRESERSLRVHPRPAPGVCAPVYMVYGTYKTLPTKVPRANFQLMIPFDDKYIYAFASHIVWAMILNSPDRSQAPMQLQLARELLAEAVMEGQNDAGDTSIHPAESLMDSYR